jgi:hypothetical protein
MENPKAALEMCNENYSLMGGGGGMSLTFSFNPLLDLWV